MKRAGAIVLAVAAALIAARAGAALSPGDTLNLTLAHDGETRLYDVHVPASYDGSTAVPLILDFHGLSSQQDAAGGDLGLQGPLRDGRFHRRVAAGIVRRDGHDCWARPRSYLPTTGNAGAPAKPQRGRASGWHTVGTRSSV